MIDRSQDAPDPSLRSRVGADPARFGEYRLLRRIAVGGMAEIYEAERASGERLALKILLPQEARDPELVRALTKEAEVQALLSHPSLVRVVAQGEVDGEPYLALEYVDGFALSDLLARAGSRRERCPLEVALFVAGEVLSALEHVHGARDREGSPLEIVHRDVTPHNVLLGRDGRVLLGDFGIARSRLSGHRTRTGVIKGKLRYLAPEQATGSRIDARIDLYGVGLLLFELMTGEPYLEGDSEVEILRRAEAPPARSAAAVAGVDPRIDRILERSLARFPEERFPDAAAFRREIGRLQHDLGAHAEAADVARWVQGLSASARGTAVEPPVTEHHRSRVVSGTRRIEAGAARRSRTRLPLAVLGFAASAALAAWVWTRSSTSPSDTEHHAVAPSGGSGATAAARGPAAAAPIPAPSTSSAARAVEPTAVILDRPRGRRASDRAPDAGHAPDAPTAAPPIASTVIADARSRLEASLSRVESRGIARADLDAARQARVQRALGWLEAGDPRAVAEVESLLPELEATQVDAVLVERKLDRVHRRIRDLHSEEARASGIEELSGAALQDIAEARYEAANRRLNEIVRRLDGPFRK
ncbi:MAG: serine/threonine protein kinase [Deltaproteobacteria bacterium]|nr:serine/threonine protein kinase [Deltaproteobacteria bacterium]